MEQDPEQSNIDETPDPQFPYGAIRQTAPSQPSYISPEFYAKQPEAPVQNAVEPSGYTIPTPEPYGTSQMQYGTQSNHGHGNYSQNYGYSAPQFVVPQASPLPLGEAIRQLPAQYWRMITKPSSTAFAEEMGKASWSIVWVQIVFYVIIVTLFGFLATALLPARTDALSGTDTSTLAPSTIAAIQQLTSFVSIVSTYGQVVLIPLSLFVGTGLLFMLAKAFGGSGKFLTQLYSTLLFLVPLGILLNVLTLVLSLIPGVGSVLSLLATFAYLGYEGTLLGFMLMPVHRLSGGRAAGAVLSLFGVAVLLACVLGFVVAIVLAAGLRTQ